LSTETAGAVERLLPGEIRRIRRTRRHPRPTQFDYLICRCLVEDLAVVLAGLGGEAREVLDVYCGSRPYEDLLPPGARCVGLDIDDRFGMADVVTHDFLPFDDGFFDLVLCTQAFHFVPDPAHGIAEIRRVLRPGGRVVITVPHYWEYDPTALEHRFTGPSLAALFDDWDQVEIVENGGRAVVSTTVTAQMLRRLETTPPPGLGLRRLVQVALVPAYLLLNSVGRALDALERRLPGGSQVAPLNLLVTAQRPSE
jgi:SAM-dependent methyltransferase